MESNRESFYRLTPHLVMEAIEAVGFDPMGVCSPLNSLENRVYRISLDQDRSLAAKFYRPGRWTLEQIQEEHDFLYELQEQEIPVAAPLMLQNQGSIAEVDGIFFSVWPMKAGRQRDEFDPETLMSLGRLIGRIHSLGSQSEFEYRPELSVDRYIHEPLRYFRSHELLDPMMDQRYSQALAALEELYLDKVQGVPMMRLHGDCHIGNILFRDDQPIFLDFDDSLTGPAVQDLWMIAGSNDKWGRQNRQWLMEGYQNFFDFNPRWWELAELLRGLRLVYYVGWLARRREDPAFQRFFSDFGTRDFWERETLELEQLLDNYRNPQHSIENFPL